MADEVRAQLVEEPNLPQVTGYGLGEGCGQTHMAWSSRNTSVADTAGLSWPSAASGRACRRTSTSGRRPVSPRGFG
ncbi:hypothetical protein [Streptomyces sp. NPDC096311]|uniref:hypothetical protein n=1 Tax=Streptomyces sp. NPDC096311 TaxID=3366083 RepID=UPI00381CC8E4